MPALTATMSHDAGGSGGTRPLVINPTLCFVLSKWGRMPAADMKDLLLGFYSNEQIYTAKDVLHSGIVALKIDGLPVFKQRRMSKGTAEQRDRKEFEDLFLLATVVDEKKIIASLPIYVCDNADSMPSSRICEMDFIALLRKLSALESNDSHMQAQLDRLLDSSRASFVAMNKIATQSQNYPPLMGGQGPVPSFLQRQEKTTAVQSPMIPSRFTRRLLTQTSDANIITTESDQSESEGGAGVFCDTDYTLVKNRNTERQRKRPRQATSPPQPT